MGNTFPHIFFSLFHCPSLFYCPSEPRLWGWLPHRLSKRKSPTKVLLKTRITQTIIFIQDMLLLGSNHFLKNKMYSELYIKRELWFWSLHGKPYYLCALLTALLQENSKTVHKYVSQTKYFLFFFVRLSPQLEFRLSAPQLINPILVHQSPTDAAPQFLSKLFPYLYYFTTKLLTVTYFQ